MKLWNWVIERGLRIPGGSIEILKNCSFVWKFFYSVVSLKLNTELCTNTVQAINNEGYSYVKQIPVQVISFYVSVHPTHLHWLDIISKTLSPYVYDDKSALNRNIY